MASTAVAFDGNPPPRRCLRFCPTGARSTMNDQEKERPPHFGHLSVRVATRDRQPRLLHRRITHPVLKACSSSFAAPTVASRQVLLSGPQEVLSEVRR